MVMIVLFQTGYLKQQLAPNFTLLIETFLTANVVRHSQKNRKESETAKKKKENTFSAPFAEKQKRERNRKKEKRNSNVVRL